MNNILRNTIHSSSKKSSKNNEIPSIQQTLNLNDSEIPQNHVNQTTTQHQPHPEWIDSGIVIKNESTTNELKLYKDNISKDNNSVGEFYHSGN